MKQYPLAVWTANHGLDWTYVREAIAFAELERCRNALKPLPDFDGGEPGFEGVWVNAERVFVARCQGVKAWDFRGRDATYLAVTWVPRSEATSTDFEALLRARELNEPMRQVPAGFVCEATKMHPGAQIGAVCDGMLGDGFDKVGEIVQSLAPGQTVAIRRNIGERGAFLKVPAPQVQGRVADPPPYVAPRPPVPPTYESNVPPSSGYSSPSAYAPPPPAYAPPPGYPPANAVGARPVPTPVKQRQGSWAIVLALGICVMVLISIIGWQAHQLTKLRQENQALKQQPEALPQETQTPKQQQEALPQETQVLKQQQEALPQKLEVEPLAPSVSP